MEISMDAILKESREKLQLPSPLPVEFTENN